jgi:hypothetical protein
MCSLQCCPGAQAGSSGLIEKCERARAEGTPVVAKCALQRRTGVADQERGLTP